MRSTLSMKWKAALTAGLATAAIALAGLVQAQQSPAQAPPPPPADAPDSAPIDATPAGQSRARLGVNLSDNHQGKVWIRSVDPGSAADIAGLRANDQFVALDEQKIFTYLDVIRYVNMKGAGDDVAVYIRRNGKPAMLTASLGSEYADPESDAKFTEFPGGTRQTKFTDPAVDPTAPTPGDLGSNGPATPWRYRNVNGQWFFYSPAGQWMTWSNNRWVMARNGFPTDIPSPADMDVGAQMRFRR
ncbi:MAG: PDZ domain-containing protein [Planctomycetes bacterium]|nr:PDZ domain-containing protein [Planctomycetota bacterium]